MALCRKGVVAVLSQTCTAAGCDRPTQTNLCPDCTNRLRDDLRALGTGGTLRVRAHRDRVATRDQLAAARPALAELERRQAAGEAVDETELTWLRERVATLRTSGQERAVAYYHRSLCAELDLTITRQQKFGVAGAGGARPTSSPLPFSRRAAELAAELRNTISTWARDLAETYPHLNPRYRSVASAADWMATVPGLLAEHPAAGEMHRDITGLVERVLRVIDRPADKVYLGQCGAELGDGAVCEADIYAPPGRAVVQCPACKAAWELTARQDYLLKAVEDQLATAVEASRALSRLDRPVTAAMIRGYAHRGRLTQHPPHPHDPYRYPRYRIGDVMDILRELEQEEAS